MSVFLCSLSITASAQFSVDMGSIWKERPNPSIGKIINDRLWIRVRAKAKARDNARNSTPTKTLRVETPVGESETSKKTSAQIEAAVGFRSTGTQLETQGIANELGGDDPELRKQMVTIISTLLTEYEKAARAQGKPNDLALATTTALVYNSSIYNGTPDPDDARIMEIRDALAELAAEADTFVSLTDRQKQILYEKLVISTMLAKAGYEEAKEKGDKTTMATYRELAGQTLKAVSGMPPEKVDFSDEAARRNAAIIDAATTAGSQNPIPAIPSSSDFLDFDPFPDKQGVQPQKPLTGRLRKSITMADLAGTWEIGGASVQEYVSSSTQSYSSVSFFGKKYTINANGAYASKTQARASNTTIRETDSGTVILDGGFIIMKSNKEPLMRYQFVAYMIQPNGAAVLSLIYLNENPPLDGNALRANCSHPNGYVSCRNGEEWVRIPK